MDFKGNEVCELLGIRYPIIQAGMVWVSGAKLAAASANAGVLGVIGAGSMKPHLLAEHLKKTAKLTTKPIAVNIPLLYEGAEEQIQVALEHGVRCFITSAGNPKKHTSFLKSKGCRVLHVVASPKFALKAEEAGVDAVIAEGFEAGGHNGHDELTTFCLIPLVKKAIKIPVIAAGGIATGEQMAAAFCLGASGVQMGTRFVATRESSAHDHFKQAVVTSPADATRLCLKKLTPVRLLKNKFYEDVASFEKRCASDEELRTLLGKGRAKKGMLEGNLEEGELEIGQVCSLIRDLPSVEECVKETLAAYKKCVLNAIK